MTTHTATLDSPLGTLRIAFRGDTLLALTFDDRWDAARGGWQARFADATPAAAPARIAQALAAYWAGDAAALDALEVDPGGTAFQRRVWARMRAIPAGETQSYAALAAACGAPGAARAVGVASATNPIWLAIPCHRVIGAAGDLRGYGGGIERKRALLAHEAGVVALAV